MYLKSKTLGKSGNGKKKIINSWTRIKDLFKWFGLLSKITDQEMKVICGTDGALYVVFNRFAAKFFALISVLNFLVIIPIYFAGSNPGKEMKNKSD